MDYKNEITTAIIAAKGQGKSVMLASYLNRLTQGILIDMIGVFNPRSQFKTAVVPNSTYFLNPEAFLKTARKGKIPKKSVVNFGDLVGEELTEEADKLFRFIYQNVPKMPILVDEIADIMPLMGTGSNEFHRLVKNGRNHGNKPIVIATQRPQNTSKQIFDLCDTFYLSSQKAPRTIEYILNLIDEKGNTEMGKKIKTLKTRQFLRYDGEKLENYKEPVYKYAFKQ